MLMRTIGVCLMLLFAVPMISCVNELPRRPAVDENPAASSDKDTVEANDIFGLPDEDALEQNDENDGDLNDEDIAVPAWSVIVAGSMHSCGIYAGALYCWGLNSSGQLGIGTDGLDIDKPVPVRVGTADDWSVVTAGREHTCGILSGELYCWGRNDLGQLGDGTSCPHSPYDCADKTTPTRIGAATDWTSIAAGGEQTCGLRGGELYCWGADYAGPSGLGFPVRIGSAVDWSTVAVGLAHSCGLRSGALYCWGDNSAGTLGDGTNVSKADPILIGVATDWSVIAAGSSHTCGIQGGEMYCWGDNWFGQLGDGTQGTGANKNAPVQIGIAADWSTVAAGDRHTCGIRDGGFYCWGYDNIGRLGGESEISFGWSAIAAGDAHTCGIRSGELYCWGANGSGQLGDGSAWRETPHPVVEPIVRSRSL